MVRPIVEGLFEVDGEGGLTLLGGYSPSSGRHHFPRSEVCPYSGVDDVVPARLSGYGTLWAWTAVTTRPAGYAGPVPYGFGVVELPEGLRVVGRIAESDPERLAFGQRMAVVAEELPGEDGDPVVVWAFAPLPEDGASAGPEDGS